MKRSLISSFLLIVLLMVMVVPVMARAPSVSIETVPLIQILPQTQESNGIAELVSQWGSLVGVAALIALIINVLKYFSVVKDGTAQTWSTAFNLLGLFGLLALKIFKPAVDVSELDQGAATLAQILTLTFGFVLQLLSSWGTHKLVSGVPVIGKTFTSKILVSQLGEAVVNNQAGNPPKTYEDKFSK